MDIIKLHATHKHTLTRNFVRKFKTENESRFKRVWNTEVYSTVRVSSYRLRIETYRH